MACTASLAPLGRCCSPQMGGLKYIYLISGEVVADKVMLAPADPGNYEPIYLGLGYEEGSSADFFGFACDSVNSAAGFAQLLYDEGIVAADLSVRIVRIDVTRQGAQMTSEAQGTRENGTLFYKNAATIPTSGLLPATLSLVKKLARAGVIVIGECYDGRFHAFGFHEQAKIETSSLTTGAAFSDLPGATIVLSAEEPSPLCADLAFLGDVGEVIENNSAALTEAFHSLALSA